MRALFTQKSKLRKSFVKGEAGFSLVELAMVLVIAGLLLGGVLKGQELIESARLRSALAQLNTFRVAVHTFHLRYDALPGDYNNAAAHIHPRLKDGDNDGVISGSGLAADSQAFQFWLHLAAAELLPLGAPTVENAAPLFGQGAPSTRLGGGFTVEHDPDPENGMHGHWYVLGSAKGEKGDGPLLTPQQAMSLDKQADTGSPRTGRIRTTEGRDVAPYRCVTREGAYNLETKEKVCVMYFQF